MFRHLPALSVVLCLFGQQAFAELTGVFSAVSRVGSKPIYVRLKVTKPGEDGVSQATGVAIVGGERLVLTGEVPGEIEIGSADTITTVDVVVDETRLRPYEVTITSADKSSTFRLARKPAVVTFAGYYTLFAPGNLKAPEPVEPEVPASKVRPELLDGHGIGVMQVTSKGLVRVSLHLADGNRMACGGAFDTAFTVPLCALTVKEGEVSSGNSFTGKIAFGPTNASDGDGLFRWTRIRGTKRGIFGRGFDFYQPVAISRYKSSDRPLKTDQGPQGRATLKGGPLTRNVQAPITFANGKLSAPEFGIASGMNLFSGHFSGNVRLPILGLDGRAAGIVFLKHNRIYGVANTPYGSAALTIEADNEHEKD